MYPLVRETLIFDCLQTTTCVGNQKSQVLRKPLLPESKEKEEPVDDIHWG